MSDPASWRLAQQTDALVREFGDHGIALEMITADGPKAPPTSASRPLDTALDARLDTGLDTALDTGLSGSADPARDALSAATQLAGRLSAHQTLLADASLTARHLGGRAKIGFEATDVLRSRFEDAERVVRAAFDELTEVAGVERHSAATTATLLLDLQAARDDE